MMCAKPQHAPFSLPPRAKRVVGRVDRHSEAKAVGVGEILAPKNTPHPQPLPTAPLRYAGGGEIAGPIT
jgi:hypothetical protein